MMRSTLSPSLFDTAYIPDWATQLRALQSFAQQEPWRFKLSHRERNNKENWILEKYVLAIFRNQVIDYLNARTQEEAEAFIHVRNGYACFHTGLMTHQFKAIYGFLERNEQGFRQPWKLRGFFDDASPKMRVIENLPRKPFFYLQSDQWGFSPNLPIRVNVNHILGDIDNVGRIPETIRGFPNLYMLLETGVEMARRTAEFIPSIVVPQLYENRVQYLLPICLTDPKKSDMVMTLVPMEGFYLGTTCLDLEMAYSNARLLARPTAPWLMELVT